MWTANELKPKEQNRQNLQFYNLLNTFNDPLLKT